MENEQSEQDGNLGTADAARLLGVPPYTVRRWATRIGGTKRFGRWRYSAAAVHAAARGTTPTTPTEDTP